MMTILESKLAQTHVALSGPNEAASTAADDDYKQKDLMFLIETSDKDSFSEGEENKSKSVDASANCSILGSLRRKHLKQLIIAHLNTDSI